MSSDQAAFLARLHEYRRQGAQALLDFGADPDPVLIGELGAPGTDQRYGVNLVVRPPPAVARYVDNIQEQLRAYEPGQYLYPAGDLHLTLIELCSSWPQSEAEMLATEVAQVLPQIASTAPPAMLERPLLGYDRRACALNFLPTNQALQSLRGYLATELANHGITIAPRYTPQSAHVTLLRYIEPLRTRPAAWVEFLQAIPSTTLEWCIDAIWLSWGATWYGMQNRTHMVGPYPLL